MSSMNSRQRMLAAINGQTPDHIPCSFISFTALRKRHAENLYELAKAELGMGLDSFLFIPSLSRPQRPDHPDLRGLPIRFSSRVKLVEQRSAGSGVYDSLHKEYVTPAGSLTTSVNISEDWPHGDHIPFIDDYQVPRAIKPLVTDREDLEPLSYLLSAPTKHDIDLYHAEVQKAKAFTAENGILLVGGWGVGMDMANWLCGIQNLIFLTMDDETFVTDLLEMIHQWNMERMRVVLAGGVDLYIRRAWYEGCDFVTPGFYERVILPRLKRETALAHEYGARFGYICPSGILPLLDHFLEAGIDLLIGVDPQQGTHTNFAELKRRTDSKMCIWGGVSGAVTVELGSEAQVRAATQQAISACGPNGFILSPVDNITVDAPLTWENIQIFIDEWQRNR